MKTLSCSASRTFGHLRSEKRTLSNAGNQESRNVIFPTVGEHCFLFFNTTISHGFPTMETKTSGSPKTDLLFLRYRVQYKETSTKVTVLTLQYSFWLLHQPLEVKSSRYLHYRCLHVTKRPKHSKKCSHFLTTSRSRNRKRTATLSVFGS